MSDIKYTEEEFKEFDRITMSQSSLSNLERIMARLDLSKFVEKHGREKCDAMWEVIKKRDGLKD